MQSFFTNDDLLAMGNEANYNRGNPLQQDDIDHAAAESEFNNKISNNDFEGAVEGLINTYNMLEGIDPNIVNFNIVQDDSNTTMLAIGNVGINEQQNISIPTGFLKLNESGDFTGIVRSLYHEYEHVHQKTVSLMNSHNFREFVAYINTLFFYTHLPMINKKWRKLYSAKAYTYYNALTDTEKDRVNYYKSKLDAEANILLNCTENCPD